MNIKKQLIPGLCVFVWLLLPLLTGCGAATVSGAATVMEGIIILKNSNQPVDVSGRLPAADIDTTETVINKHGQPQEIYDIDEQRTKQIFVYDAGKSISILAFVYNPEKEKMMYKQLLRGVKKETFLKSKQQGTIKTDATKAFTCFRDSEPAEPKPSKTSSPKEFPGGIPGSSFIGR